MMMFMVKVIMMVMMMIFFGGEQRDIGEGPASLMAHRDIEEEP